MKKKNMYWTEEDEALVVKYRDSNQDPALAEQLYPKIYKMCECIFNSTERHKYLINTPPGDVIADLATFIFTKIIPHFNADKIGKKEQKLNGKFFLFASFCGRRYLQIKNIKLGKLYDVETEIDLYDKYGDEDVTTNPRYIDPTSNFVNDIEIQEKMEMIKNEIKKYYTKENLIAHKKELEFINIVIENELWKETKKIRHKIIREKMKEKYNKDIRLGGIVGYIHKRKDLIKSLREKIKD